MKISWKPDQDGEALMKECALTWKIEKVSVQAVDREGSLANNARLDAPLNDDVVIDYAQGMTNGSVFPRVVLHRQKKGFRVLSGNHRTEAAKFAGVTELEAYVVTGDDPIAINAFVRLANRTHGLRISTADAVRHAAEVVHSGTLWKRRHASSTSNLRRCTATCRRLECRAGWLWLASSRSSIPRC